MLYSLFSLSRGIEMTIRRYGMLLSGYLLVLIVYFIFIGLTLYPRGDAQFLTDDAVIRDLGLLDQLANNATTQIVVAGRSAQVCCYIFYIPIQL